MIRPKKHKAILLFYKGCIDRGELVVKSPPRYLAAAVEKARRHTARFKRIEGMFMESVMRSRLFALLIGLGFIAFDQWVKLQALVQLQTDTFRLGSSYAWLDIALSLNPGAFLSLGAGLSPAVKQLIFIVGVGGVVCWAIWWALSRWASTPGKAAAVYFIALGGASNLIDRVFREGHVVDYLILNLGPVHTGVFNIADIAIMVGAGVLLVEEMRKSRKA
jgi:signal peptidase II